MRIVQTFWTAGHNPLEYGFGWPHAEYNLMSWALSCLSLREHYDEVVLYTDTPGKRVLIDELHLPYTDVQVVFDDFPCLPHHWALAKIKTYSLQTKPFLHVDGDIYVPRPLPEEVLAAPLIAQNREIGTVYYRRMMDRILSYPEIKLPDYIEQGLREESIASYNMGFFGGSDLSFIHDFCKEVFRFMEENRMNDSACPHSRVDCNVFFEQVIFAMMVDREHDNVASVLGRDMRDNGYTRREFCDLAHYDAHPFHHLLGGHKRKMELTDLLEHFMLWSHADYSKHIIQLTSTRGNEISQSNIRLSWNVCIGLQKEKENSILRQLHKWYDLSIEEIISWEQMVAKCAMRLIGKSVDWDEIELTANKSIILCEVPENLSYSELKYMRNKLHCREFYPLHTIVISPKLPYMKVREIPIGDLDKKILLKIGNGNITTKELFASLFLDLHSFNELEMRGAYRHLIIQLRYLIKRGLIIYNDRDINTL